MDLALTSEHQQLQQVTRRFLKQHSPEAAVRRLMETDDGYDPDVWELMATQIGLQAIPFPESAGGLDGGFTELVLIMEEMGRALLCAPFFGSVVLAGFTLLQAGEPDELTTGYLERIAGGQLLAALAVAEESGRWAPHEIRTTARQDDGAWLLDGSKAFVVDGCTARLILVVARTPRGLSLFSVEAGAAGLSRRPMTTVDQTRKQARVELRSTPARLIGRDGDAVAILDRVADRAGIALAAEQLGGARYCLEMAVSYAKTRVQFGRPIGSFQAVQHRLSELLLEVELLAAGVRYAAACLDASEPESDIVAALVRGHAGEAYVRVATEAIQVLGGIGFTWEHPAHLYFRRATSSATLLGGPEIQRELLASRLGLDQRRSNLRLSG